MTRVCATLAMLGWLAGATALAAQSGVKLHEHDRVRLTRWDLTVVSGRVLWISDDSILLAQRGRTATFAPNQVRTLEVFAGRRSHKLRGALIGGIVGAAIGGLAGGASKDACSIDAYSAETCSTAASAAGGALVFGVLGAGVGTLLGAIRRDHWISVPRPWKPEPR